MTDDYFKSLSQNWPQQMINTYMKSTAAPSVGTTTNAARVDFQPNVESFLEAASKGKLKELLQFTSNMDIDCKNSHNETPLIAATIGGQTKAVFFLLAKGACVTTLDATGNSAIHHAALLEHTDIIDKLVDKCDPNIKNRNGQTIIHLVVEKNKYITLDHIVKISKIKLDEQDNVGDTAVHIAVRTNNIKVLSKLLSMSVNLSLYNYEGMNPLNLAVENDELELFKEMLQSKGGMDFLQNRTEYGESNLEIAIRQKHCSIINYLLGSQMNAGKMISTEIDKTYGSTALHWAVLQFNLDLVEKIIRLKPELMNVKDKLGKTPLDHVCSIHGLENTINENILNVAIKLIAEGSNMTLIENRNGLFKLIRDTFRFKFKC